MMLIIITFSKCNVYEYYAVSKQYFFKVVFYFIDACFSVVHNLDCVQYDTVWISWRPATVRWCLIAAVNKPVLLQQQLLDKILPFATSPMSVVLFKLLGTLRMAVDGQSEKICCYSHIFILITSLRSLKTCTYPRIDSKCTPVSLLSELLIFSAVRFLLERHYVTLCWGICCRKFICRLSSYSCSYSAGWNFPQCFYAILYPRHPLTSTQNFIEIVQGEPFCQELHASSHI